MLATARGCQLRAVNCAPSTARRQLAFTCAHTAKTSFANPASLARRATYAQAPRPSFNPFLSPTGLVSEAP